MEDNLKNFYHNWSNKSEELIQYHNDAAVRKIDAMEVGMPLLASMNFKNVIDYGCGYGKALQIFAARQKVDRAYGFDFSERAIEYAERNFSGICKYYKLSHLDIDKNMAQINNVLGGKKADCVLLIDLLEHVPDCVQLIKRLSEVTKYFIIKLPIEEVVLNNYLIRKNYPSSTHDNGHLREFSVNSVYYFVRKLGLTPMMEGVHIYDFKDSFPPLPPGVSMIRRFRRLVLKSALVLLSYILPKRIYIRVFGPGSYYCVATFDSNNILMP